MTQYDEGYRACPCFWGRSPGSLIIRLLPLVEPLNGKRVLDAGCGEGKNAHFFATRGASVLAIDASRAAIANARAAWPPVAGLKFAVRDVRSPDAFEGTFDIVIAYGLLHCLPSRDVALQIVRRLQSATRAAGYHVVCAFNDRNQDMSAHPGFHPTLLRHEDILGAYGSPNWVLVFESDSDLHETHPHNRIPHVHSLTRLIARRDHA